MAETKQTLKLKSFSTALFVFLTAPAGARVIAADLRLITGLGFGQNQLPVYKIPHTVDLAEGADFMMWPDKIIGFIGGNELNLSILVILLTSIHMQNFQPKPLGFFCPALGRRYIMIMSMVRMQGLV
jgi:hypothetical protein